METAKFNDILQHQIELSTSVLIKKAGEYATGDDRLYNFKQAAHLQGITMRQALGGMMAKHVVSVYDIINSPTIPSEEYIEEKLGDNLNYLLLLKAVLEEERVKENGVEEETGWYDKEHLYVLPLGAEIPDQPDLEFVVSVATTNQAASLEQLGYTEYNGPLDFEELFAQYANYDPEKAKYNGWPGWYVKGENEALFSTHKQAHAGVADGWTFDRGTVNTQRPDERLGWYKKDSMEVLVEDAGTRRRYQDLGWTFDREYGSDHIKIDENNPIGWYDRDGMRVYAHTVENAKSYMDQGWIYSGTQSPNLAHDGS